jgi:RNA polymerase sigma-70 factor (ECF subfamily)
VGAWDELVPAPDPALEAMVDYDWQQQAVRQALRQLTYEQQHVLALRFAETRSFAEIARVMGKSVGAVKNLQYRALGALRHELGRMEGGT